MPAQEQALEPVTPLKVKTGFRLGTNKVAFQQLLPKLEKDCCWHIPSRGQWSTHHAIEHLLSLTGPANIVLCSWAISEEAIKSLLKLEESGQILSLQCLFDTRVQQYARNAHQIAQKSIVSIGLTKCHAKLCLIDNAHWHVSIAGSANLSRNRRVELYIITENEDLNEQHALWMKEEIAGSNPFQTNS